MAFTEFFTNLASCTLASGYTAADASITVSSTTGDDPSYPFPVTAPFRLSLYQSGSQKVILKVTAITDGTHFAVTAEGHDANAASGSVCYGVITAAALTAIRTDAGTVANLTGLGTNVGTFLGTPSSANLAAALTDETGSGAAVFANTPTLVTPILGTPTSGVATNLTGTASGLTSGITNALKSATTTVNVSAATAPTSGQVLTATAGTTATWQTPSGGSPSPYGYNFVAIVNANWTTIGAGGTRTNTTNNGPSGGPTIALASATGGSGSIYGVTATVAAGDFTRYAQFWATSALAVDFTTVGFGVTDGTKCEYAQLIYISSSGIAIRSGKASALAAGTYAAANGDTNNLLLVGTAGGVWNNPVLLKINRTGTTYTGSYSVDGGANYITVFSDTTPYLTATDIIVLTDARGGANAGKLTLFSSSDGNGNAS